MKSADELFSDGLVAKLELKPGKLYILVFDRRSVSGEIIREVGRVLLERYGITCLSVRVYGKAADAIVGLEVK